jgi:hypothetical protein
MNHEEFADSYNRLGNGLDFETRRRARRHCIRHYDWIGRDRGLWYSKQQERKDFEMLRSSLVFLALGCAPAFCQPADMQARIAANQNLIRHLTEETSRYKPTHPDVARSRALVSVLEEQSRLMQQPRENWDADAVQRQVKAISAQLDLLGTEAARYKEGNPTLTRDREIIALLKDDFRVLQP